MFEIFDNADVEDLLDEFGVNILYYKAKKCTCIIENSGRWDPKDNCYFGWRFEEPIKLEVVRTNYKMDISNINLGEIFHGGCHFTVFKKYTDNTPNPMWRSLSQGDVIVNLDDVARKVDQLDIGKRNFLYAFNIVQVLSVYYKGKTYVEGKDYNVKKEEGTNPKTIIEWIDEGEKPDKYYSVEFEYNVNYWLFNEMPKQRGAGDDSLPKSVTCIIRPYGETETKNLLKYVNYAEPPDENINIENEESAI
jgi:hypothetical protein